MVTAWVSVCRLDALLANKGEVHALVRKGSRLYQEPGQHLGERVKVQMDEYSTSLLYAGSLTLYASVDVWSVVCLVEAADAPEVVQELAPSVALGDECWCGTKRWHDCPTHVWGRAAEDARGAGLPQLAASLEALGRSGA